MYTNIVAFALSRGTFHAQQDVLDFLLQDFNKDAILQQFEFAADEKLLCILSKSYPFYWHEKLEDQQIKHLHDQDDQTGSWEEKVLSAYEIPLSSFTVLDGCMVITDTTVYECKPWQVKSDQGINPIIVSYSPAQFPSSPPKPTCDFSMLWVKPGSEPILNLRMI